MSDSLHSIVHAANGFMPHGHCYLWQPPLVWTMVITDGLIALAYFSISISLVGLVRRIQLPFHAIFIAFGLFIFACGAGHAMDIYTLWVPNYWAEAGVKVVTALASVATALWLYPARARVVAFAEAAQSSEKNRLALQAANAEMEERIKCRTEELAEANRELMESEERFRSLIDMAPVGMALVSASGECILVNPKFKSILGYELQDLAGRHVSDFAHPDDRERSRATFAALKRGEMTSHTYEKRYLKKGGGEVWVQRTASVVRDAQGGIKYVILVFQDISERRASDEALAKSAEHLRVLTEAMPQLVWTSDATGNPIYANAQCIRYTGYEVTEKQGGGWTEAIHPEDAPLVYEQWMKSIQEGSIFQAEYRMKNAQGNYRWFIGRSVPIRAENGRILSWIGTATDIDEQKKAHDFLEEEVRKRTEELLDTNVALTAANHELEAFSYSVSHDLRAPLRGIDGFSQALLEDYEKVLDDTGRQYLRFVREGIQQMGRLIDDLLNLSRLTRSELNKEPVDLSVLARRVADRLNTSYSHQVEFMCPPTLVIHGDSGLMTAAIENLLENAWKFTSKARPARVELGTLDREGRQVFFVRDNGAGFNMDYVGKLFGAFQRLHSKKEFAGTGIGLATVRRVIQRHGGQVWAEGKVGEGATFFFTLGSLRQRENDTISQGEKPTDATS